MAEHQVRLLAVLTSLARPAEHVKVQCVEVEESSEATEKQIRTIDFCRRRRVPKLLTWEFMICYALLADIPIWTAGKSHGTCRMATNYLGYF